MAIQFKFDPAKALEALLYVVTRLGTDKYATLKVLYVADKLHLQRYGRFISGDYYHALPKGPTPMLSYDMIECAAGNKPACRFEGVREALRVGTDQAPHALVPLRAPNLDLFSESDLECLDEVIANVAPSGPGEVHKVLWEQVHDGAWKHMWASTRSGYMDVELIARQFPNADELIEYLRRA